ncbi:Uncharacterised protein [Chlamydia abortus]|nr:Uncharacterised protein [Chlamydia abortus]
MPSITAAFKLGRKEHKSIVKAAPGDPNLKSKIDVLTWGACAAENIDPLEIGT